MKNLRDIVIRWARAVRQWERRCQVSNCLIFAVRLLLRRWGKAEHPGVFTRKSHFGWFPHFVYQETRRGRVRQISYKPLRPVARALPPPCFRGSVRWGDDPPAAKKG